MKKKVMCMLLTGMMAASMIAGCGNSGNASANAGAVTNTDAGTDTSGAADNSTDQSADVTPDTTAASAAAESSDFDNSDHRCTGNGICLYGSAYDHFYDCTLAWQI